MGSAFFSLDFYLVGNFLENIICALSHYDIWKGVALFEEGEGRDGDVR